MMQLYNDSIQKHQILEGLLELNVRNDDEYELLSEQYKNLLQNKQQIEQSYKKDFINNKRLIGILIDFYIDRNKHRGVNVKNKIESFVEQLKIFNYDLLHEFLI
jgi:Bardet-Biedl syndrome 7 protein